MKTRNEVPENLKWRTDHIFKDVNEWNENAETLKGRLDFSAFVGKLGDKKELLACFNKMYDCLSLLEKLYKYHYQHSQVAGVAHHAAMHPFHRHPVLAVALQPFHNKHQCYEADGAHGNVSFAKAACKDAANEANGFTDALAAEEYPSEGGKDESK